MSQLLMQTLGNEAWLTEHEDALKAVLPETFTHVANVNLLAIGFKLKLLGVDWRSQNELAGCMSFMERAGFLLRNGLTIKRNPHKVMQ